MKKNFVFLSVLFALMISGGCSSVKKNKASDPLKNNGASTAYMASADGLSPNDQISSASDPNSSPKGETRIGAYNSQISVSYDGSGNKIENRSFENHPRVEFLIVTTPVKGEQEVIIFGKDGKMRKMPINQFNDVLSASPDEISDRAGILEPLKPVAPPPQIATKIEPIQTEASLVSTPPVQPLPGDTTAVETNKTELAVEPEKSPVQQAKQPVTESENKNNPNQF
jgi:hypothetical protein